MSARDFAHRPDRSTVGPVGAPDVDVRPFARTGHADEPGIAAHFAILDERPSHILLDMHLDLFPAVGARDREGVHLHRRTISELRAGGDRNRTDREDHRERLGILARSI